MHVSYHNMAIVNVILTFDKSYLLVVLVVPVDHVVHLYLVDPCKREKNLLFSITLEIAKT